MVLLMITFQAPEVPRVMLQLVVSQPAERPPFPLAGGRVVIGRELGSDLLLDDSSVSRHHAEIVREGDVWTIRDLGSTNGVYVNDALVAQARLAAGDRLRLGVFELSVLEVAAAEPVAPVHATILRRVEDFSADWGMTGAEETLTAPAAGDAPPGPARRLLDPAYGNRVFGYLIRLAKLLLKATSVDEVLEQAMAIAFEALPAQRGFALLRRDDGELACELARFDERVLLRPSIEPPVSKTILQVVMDERVALVTDDALSDDRLASGHSILLHQIRAAMCVPLWSGESILGVLQLDTAFRPGAFSEQDLELLTAIANYAAVAIERIRYAEKVEAEIKARSRLERYHSPAVIEAVLAREEPREDEIRGLENAVVTVLFADIVGFTAFAEAAEPRDVVARLNAYFDRAVEAVFGAGGTLDKFIGDCVMAFFGAPVAVPDHARRAVEAAVAIQREVARLNESAPPGLPPLAVRVAVNSGPVMVGDVGSQRRVDYTVLGNTVNVAARLEAFAAKPGEVVIGAETHRLLDGAVPVEPLGELQLKGLERRVTAYRVRLDPVP